MNAPIDTPAEVTPPLALVLYANMHDGQGGGVMTVSVDDHVKETVEVITEYLLDDEQQGLLQKVALAAQGDSNDHELRCLREALSNLLVKLGTDLPDADDISFSSASRQHFIDTGRYLVTGEEGA